MPHEKFTPTTSLEMQRKVSFDYFFLLFVESYQSFLIDFLLYTRNIFERRKLGVSRRVGDDSELVWKKDQISSPLESDEAVIEFLAKHDYDINKAKFYLTCLLSGGRGRAMRLLTWANISTVQSCMRGLWGFSSYIVLL